MALRFFLFGCLFIAVSAYQDNGHSIIISPGDAGSNVVAGRAFENRLGREILDRILQGKAVKVSLEETRRLTYEQETECNNCNQPTQPPVTTTPLPPGPTLTRYGNFVPVVPCTAIASQILYTGLSAASSLPITWHNRLQFSSDTIDANQANPFVLGPDANGNFAPAMSEPVDNVYQTYEVWVMDSWGRQSVSVYITFDVQGANSCIGTSTTWGPVTTSESSTWYPESTTEEGTTSATTVTPEPVCDPCTGIGCPNSQRDCFECLISGGDETACEETTTLTMTMTPEHACNPCTGTGGPNCVKDCLACSFSGDQTACQE